MCYNPEVMKTFPVNTKGPIQPPLGELLAEGHTARREAFLGAKNESFP